MVRVDHNTTDQIVAWRVRDALAAHPLLGGCLAQIAVIASYEGVVLNGWTQDEQVRELAVKLAHRAAGARTVHANLQMKQQTDFATEPLTPAIPASRVK